MDLVSRDVQLHQFSRPVLGTIGRESKQRIHILDLLLDSVCAISGDPAQPSLHQLTLITTVQPD